MEMSDLMVLSFEGRPVGLFHWKGRRAALAREVGYALGYASDGHQFIKNVTEEWGEELVDGVDVEIVRGAELKALKAVLGHVGESPLSRVPALVLLFDTGIRIAGLLSRKPKARAFRRWLAEEVLPQIEETGAYRSPSATNARALPDDALDRIDALERQVEAFRIGHVAATTDARPLIGAGAARAQILDPLRAIAALRARAMDPEAFSRIRGELETRLRAEIGFPAHEGARWANLPRVKLGDAVLAIHRLRGEARRLARAAGAQMAMRLQ